MNAPPETLLSIGGVVMAITSADGRARATTDDPIVQRFEIAGPRRAADVEVGTRFLDRYLPPSGPLLFDSGSVWKLFSEADGRWRIECHSDLFGEVPYKIAFISSDFRSVDLAMRPIEGRDLSPLQFPLDELLVNAVLTRNGGVEVHSCGVIDHDGSAYLFAGNSGDGKTTTSLLWTAAGAEIISDDRVIIREDHEGWWLYGTPWHGEANVCSPSRGRLRHIFLLDKESRPALSPVPPAAAVARLLACAFPPFHDPAGVGSVLETLGRIAQTIPISKFAFVNDASAVETVRALASQQVMA